MENSPFVDSIEQFKTNDGSQRPKQKLVLNAEKAIEFIDDPQMKAEVRAYLEKAVQSTDLQGIRLVSVYDQVGVLSNEQTIFRSICEKNGVYRSTDYQIKWQEQYMGAGGVEFFNLNNNTNPAEAQMNRGQRSNTMGAYGWTLNLPFIVEALSAQSPVAPQDEKMAQVRMGLGRMRRFSNEKLLYNTEITNEINLNAQWGGFINRSTAYNLALAPGSNLTNGIIQGRVDTIANNASNNGLGYQRPLVALTSNAQIQQIRSIMIDRFPGENSQTYRATQDELELAGLTGLVVPAQTRAFQPDPGLPVIFIQEPQLPSGTTVFFDPSQVKLAKFQMLGSLGPWVVERFTSTLNRLYVIFDFESLIDEIIVSRSVVSGVA